jgi:exopolysaccharide production protein ExoZ
VQKLSSLQAARGLAAVFVVAFHSIFINAKYVSGESILPDIFVFGQTGVDLFFVISGFVLIVAFHNRLGDRALVADFLKRRFFRIYPVYWVYFAALAAVYMLKPGVMNSSVNGEINLLASFLLLPDETLPLLMVAWSLIQGVWFYLVFACILFLPASWCARAFAVWFLAIIAAAVLLPVPESPYLRIAAHPFTLEFIMGAFAGMTYMRLKERSLGMLVIGAISLFVGLVGIAYSVRTDVVDGSDVIGSISLERAFAVGGSYALVLLALALHERYQAWQMPRVLTALGDISYSMYLSHILTLSLLGRIWVAFGYTGQPFLGAVGFWLAASAAVIAVSYLSYRLIERPLIHVFKTRTYVRTAHAS